MDILILLIPISLFLGVVGFFGFLFSIKTNQYDDLEGNAHRILISKYDNKPKQKDSEWVDEKISN